MQIIVLLIFLTVWLLVLWLGSIAFEATGLQRPKARFQALSTLTGTGFTTTEAEAIVGHPKRRKIATYLIFLGNTGILAFIIVLILYVRAGLTAPSLVVIIVTVVVLLTIGLSFGLGLIDRITNSLLHASKKGKANSGFAIEQIFHKVAEFGIVRIAFNGTPDVSDLQLKNTCLAGDDITVLAVERNNILMSSPIPDTELLVGDYLLCYGKVKDIEELIST